MLRLLGRGAGTWKIRVRLFRSASLAAGVAAQGGVAVDFRLISKALLKTYPAEQEVPASSLWADTPCVVYVARRLG